MKKSQNKNSETVSIAQNRVSNPWPKVKNDLMIFLSFLLNIPILLSLGLTILLFFLSSKTDIQNLKLFYSIIASALSGVLGGLVTNHVIELTNNGFALKKSISAIRNLQLIKQKVSNLTTRVSDLKNDSNRRDFDEIENLSNNLNKDIINSISDWGDINPASTVVVDNFEVMSEKEQEIKNLKKNNVDLETNLEEIANSSESEKKLLADRIKEKEAKILELQREVSIINRSNIGLTSGTPLNLSGMEQPYTKFVWPNTDSDSYGFVTAAKNIQNDFAEIITKNNKDNNK